MADPRVPDPETHHGLRDPLALVALLALAAAVRFGFLGRVAVPAFDPWRHLKLLDNLRDGQGFTLFEGQPYIWYQPAWYYLCALLPRSIGPHLVAAALSTLAVGALYLWMRLEPDEASRNAAPLAAALMAVFGPVVAFTGHYGSEAFALALTFGALAIGNATPASAGAGAAGVMFGVAICARLTFAFDVFLFFPALRTLRRAGAFAGGCAIPVLFAWWRNHRAVVSHEYLFTWDGLATRTADFDVVSTLVVQRHPAVAEALRRLHAAISPVPQWLWDARGFAWDSALFMVLGGVALILCRRWHLLLAGAVTLGYFLVFDQTLSSNFLRIYLALFPVQLAALAIATHRWTRHLRRGSLAAALGVGGIVAVLGASYLRPPAIGPLAYYTPPAALLEHDAYFVNSAFFHPESVMFRFPGKSFIGMPLEPRQFEELRRIHPRYRAVLWHEFGVQGDLRQYLETDGGYRVTREAQNEHGRTYWVLEPSPDAPAEPTVSPLDNGEDPLTERDPDQPSAPSGS